MYEIGSGSYLCVVSIGLPDCLRFPASGLLPVVVLNWGLPLPAAGALEGDADELEAAVAPFAEAMAIEAITALLERFARPQPATKKTLVERDTRKSLCARATSDAALKYACSMDWRVS
jgi:hypothetical protein